MYFNHRQFLESENYECQQRHVTGLSGNGVWLYTVDIAFDVRSDREIAQLVRWVARVDEGARGKKCWRRWRTYNIRSMNQWNSASEEINSCIDEVFPLSDRDFRTLDPISSETTTRDDENARLSEELLEARALAKKQKAKAQEYRRDLREWKRHSKQMRRMLGEFARLVENSESREKDVHRYIVEKGASWIFGLEYHSIESKVKSPPGSNKFEFDLMLRRNDGFLDLVELKGPNTNLFDMRTRNRAKLNVDLSTALGQVLAYLHECDRGKRKRIFKPKALIVIGRRTKENDRQKRLLVSHLARVDVLTYDDLIERGKSLISHIEKRKY